LTDCSCRRCETTSLNYCHQRAYCEISGSHGGDYEVRVFWDIAPCSHVEVDRRFRGAYCLHHQDDQGDHRLDDEVLTSETSVNFNATKRCYIPEDSKL
jgi:hypothetical protein